MKFKAGTSRNLDVVCLSHLRWHFVYQRPQHLMTRCARDRRVYFIEEPEFVDGAAEASLRLERTDSVTVVVPQLPHGLPPIAVTAEQRRLLDKFMLQEEIRDFVLWYYTPMALSFTDHLAPRAIVYDCMDELSAFKGAPPDLAIREAALLERTSLVLTGGHALYDTKRHSHHNVHPVPSSVDVAHFAEARRARRDPPDQAAIGHPRLGFFGVIDERMNLDLLDGLACARPEWQVIMIGPVVKIDRESLPQRPNIHYLGAKAYEDLPGYIGGWNLAIMPFAINEATRFISPTKTPEYLAAGRPVVSTPIRDVVQPYGQLGLVRIASDVPTFVRACEAAMADDPIASRARAAEFLSHTSWDETWRQIRLLLDRALASHAEAIRAFSQQRLDASRAPIR